MDLFELIDREVEKEKPKEECPHKFKKKTLTIWPGETHERLTWTCESCNHVWGRMR